MSQLQLTIVMAVIAAYLVLFASKSVTARDPRIEYLLHSLPRETQILAVVQAPNCVFDQNVIQYPDPETCLQLASVMCFWPVKQEIKQKEVLLSAHAVLTPINAPGSPTYASAHFLFLSPDKSRDLRVEHNLRLQSESTFCIGSKTVFRLPDNSFFCLLRSGLLIYSNDMKLMETLLSRSGAWWKPRVALCENMAEWTYVDTRSPYWGLRHFDRSDTTSPTHASASQLAIDDQAVGVTYKFVGLDNPMLITYLSSSPNRANTARNFVDSDIDFDRTLVTPLSSTAVLLSAPQSEGAYAVWSLIDPNFYVYLKSTRCN